MASAYGILRQYGTYVDPYDFNMIQQGLAYKQQRFDANAAKIQSQVDKYSSIQLARGVDQDYFNDRMQGLIDQVNGLGGADLSKGNVASKIGSHINKVLDKKVITAYKGTQNLAKLHGEIEAARKSGKGTYSEGNHRYALRGAEAWMAGTEAGEAYGGGTYTPYTDTRGKLNKTMTDLVKTKGEQEITVPQLDAEGRSTGYMKTTKIKELNADEIRTVATNMLDSNDLNQLKIDGWLNYGSKDPSEVDAALKVYGEGRIGAIDNHLAVLRARKNNASTTAEKAKYSREINDYQNRRLGLENKINSYKGNPDAAGMFLEQERLYNGLIATHQFKETSEIYSVDDAHWKQVNYNYTKFKDNRNYDLEQGKFRHKVASDARTHNRADERLALDKAVAASASGKVKKGKDGKYVDVPTAPIMTTTEVETEDKPDTVQWMEDRVGSKRQGVLDAADKATQKMGTDDAKAYKAAVSKKVKGGMDEVTAVMTTLDAYGLNSGEVALAGSDYAQVLEQEKAARESAIPTVDSWGEIAYKGVMEGDALLGNNAFQMKTYTTTSNGISKRVTTSYDAYLRDKGINSYKELQENPELFKEFQKDVTGDLLISSFAQNTWRSAFGGGGLPSDLKDLDFATSKGDASARGLENYFTAFAKAAGLNVKFDDVFETKKGGKWYEGNVALRKRIGVKDNLKEDAKEAFDFLQGKLSGGEYDQTTGWMGEDDSFQDISDLRAEFSPNRLENNYREQLETLDPYIKRGLGYTYSPGTVDYGTIRGLKASGQKIGSKADIKLVPTTSEEGIRGANMVTFDDKGKPIQHFIPDRDLLANDIKIDYNAKENLLDPTLESALPITFPTPKFFDKGDEKGRRSYSQNEGITDSPYLSKDLVMEGLLGAAPVRPTKEVQAKYDKKKELVSQIMENHDQIKLSFDPDNSGWYTTMKVGNLELSRHFAAAPTLDNFQVTMKNNNQILFNFLKDASDKEGGLEKIASQIK